MPDQINALRAWWDTLFANSPSLGYYPSTKKTWLIVKKQEIRWNRWTDDVRLSIYRQGSGVWKIPPIIRHADNRIRAKPFDTGHAREIFVWRRIASSASRHRIRHEAKLRVEVVRDSVFTAHL